MKRFLILLLISFLLLTGDNTMPNFIGNNDFRGYLSYLAQQGDASAGDMLNYVGGDYTGSGDTGINLGELGQRTVGAYPAQDESNLNAGKQAVADAYGRYQSQNTGGTGGAAVNSTADTQAYYDQQLADIDRLLGRTNTAESQGLQSLQDSAAEQKRLIEEQRQRALNTYDNQKLETDQSKERGFGQVNDFANNSYRSLMRLFQGGNAGGGSAAKQLMPSLVSKSAGTRRQGVIDQAGQNYRAIDSARADAESQFGYNSQDIENQRKNQERDFLLGIGNQRNSLDTQKGQLQVQRAQASGQGYAQARSAADASRNSVDARQAQLDALFGTYKPQYTARATNLQTPTLGNYTIDPAQINGNQNLSVDSRYYGSQLQKKKQQEQGF